MYKHCISRLWATSSSNFNEKLEQGEVTTTKALKEKLWEKKVEATQESIKGWRDKQNVVYIHIMKYYSILKPKEILTHATTVSVNLKIILNERNQTKSHILYDSIYVKFKIGQNQSKWNEGRILATF